MKQEKTPQFKMKKNQLHYLPEIGGFVNSNTVTDEIAVAMLSESSAHLSKFEDYPPDWDKLVTAYRKKRAKKASEVQAETKVSQEPAESVQDAKVEPVQDEDPEEEVPAYQAKLIAMNGIAEKTAQKIIQDFPTEAALEAHIAAGKDLSYSPQANKALLEAYGG